MKISFGKSNTMPLTHKGLRGKIVELNEDKINEFLEIHDLPTKGTLDEKCMRITKQYKILQDKFDAKKKQGLSPVKFSNFQNTPEYEKYFENEMDSHESAVGFSGWESNFSDFKNFNEGLGADFQHFSLSKVIKSVTQPIGKAAAPVVAVVKDQARLTAAPIAMLAGKDLKYETGLGKLMNKANEVKTQFASNALSGATGGMVNADMLKGVTNGNSVIQVPESQVVVPSNLSTFPSEQLPVYSNAPLSTVRDNVVATGAREWLNSDRDKAIDILLDTAAQDKRRAEIKAELIKIGVDPKRFTSFVGENFDIKKAQESINDILGGVIEGEKAKATMSAMPKIIFIVIVALGIGYFVAKKG